MKVSEFTQEMLKLGYSEEEIDRIIQDEMERWGDKIEDFPWEFYLIGLPVDTQEQQGN